MPDDQSAEITRMLAEVDRLLDRVKAQADTIATDAMLLAEANRVIVALTLDRQRALARVAELEASLLASEIRAAQMRETAAWLQADIRRRRDSHE